MTLTVANSLPVPVNGKVVLISDHDYRTRRRANMHPIADALVRLGYDVTFISVRFSALSRLKGDSRTFLWDQANTAEMHNGVRCYLWRTLIHPFYPRRAGLNELASLLYRAYANSPNTFLDQELSSASGVIVESGLGAVLLDRARRCNPDAIITYVASDDLETVGVHPFVQSRLELAMDSVDHFCLPSSKMAMNFRWAGDKVFHVPHGIDPADFNLNDKNPYRSSPNAVSVGSMLFDEMVFVEGASRCPGVQFHVIGAGMTFDAPPNVHQYSEMPFKDTIAYIRHADVGIAPYRPAPGCDYLCDTSMKLMQYQYLGIPAVCPIFAAGNSDRRFGYTPDDPDSMAQAIDAALASGRRDIQTRFLTWEDVAQRLLQPRAFSDTRA